MESLQIERQERLETLMLESSQLFNLSRRIQDTEGATRDAQALFRFHDLGLILSRLQEISKVVERVENEVYDKINAWED